jgi:leucyl aminopeptidase
MKIETSHNLSDSFKADATAIFYSEIGKLPREMQTFISAHLADIGYAGKSPKPVIIYPHGVVPVKKFIIAGLPEDRKTMDQWFDCVAQIARAAKESGSVSLGFIIPGRIITLFGLDYAVRSTVIGIRMGTYEFLKHKKPDPETQKKPIETVTLITPQVAKTAAADAEFADTVSDAIGFARDLVNEPPAYSTPEILAGHAKRIARDNPEIQVEILDRKQMEKLGMNALLAIAQGSDIEPRFIKLEYHGGGDKKIALIGKGITFDSGGLSLKPEGSMETMKLDMAGAAAILGVFSVIAKIKPKLNVFGIMAVCENMPSGKAIKPGDVVTSLNGKTIEIVNTDAEGRVILADAVSYAGKFIKPDVMIDLATLTGACMVALGEDVAGIFSNNRELADNLLHSAELTGERLWELPLLPEFKEMLKSPIADIKNIIKSRYGGAISGATFIGEFVPGHVAWAHLDIAGPAFAEENKPFTPYGGTGYGVRLLLNYLSSLA